MRDTLIIRGDFSRKIKTTDELIEAIGPFPRENRVVMCHGTFDIVHPGHIRHLMYARDRGATLVVSLTADAHISKANYRPHIPENLRAMNLAALELVDYVVIDRDPTPISNLNKIQPDMFVKGYEYGAQGLPPKTQAEKDTVESYGGEILFTPGDVVFSSSAIIDSDLPNLSADKLAQLMDVERLTFQDIYDGLDAIRGLSVHVVGDLIVDSLTRTQLIGASGKTPTFSVRYEGRSDYVGGAGIVAKHLRAAGGEVTFTTVLGDDGLKDFALKDLEEAGVTVNAVIDKSRPTTNKNAFVAEGYRMLKVDTLDNRAISDRYLDQVCNHIRSVACDMVVMSDFRHGIFNDQNNPSLLDAIPDGAFKVGDSQLASRWGNILDFRNFDLITPNEKEARFALGDQDSVVRPLGSKLYLEAGCKVLMLKMGARGMMTFRGDIEATNDRAAFFTVDSFTDHVTDAVGSGDALLSYASMALKATGNEVVASILGAVAAACECEFDGNIPVKPKDVIAKLRNIERRVTYQ
jgi:rfaE bifunctional protein nucleotidyltransferase chain/domain